ncbi:HAD-IC family P-type ATPase [Mumia sp. zg.B21]|uniref:cation-translocating P-type ATPase n=1 Tax=Mumia sp. zg.B21 TaxID=2855447 RepID=UPI001C6E84FA|nr:HAD-IC family P-type ATPase [Mumia sp. zg.B21]MBW9208531.1 HAD-IC family P-type ATPase [Mumia sp. zg.B21]
MDEVTDQPPVWATPVDEVLERLGTSRDGLTDAEAERRLADVGPNRLPPPEPTPWWKRVVAQFEDTLIYILLASAAAKAVLEDWVDFTVILAVAVINAAIGLIQEGRAEKALAGIRTMLSVQADVRRDGGWRRVDAEALAPGDVVRLRGGDKVPADLRLLAASNLQVEESALTGESVPSSKDVDVVAADAGVGDRADMVFSGTLVTQGSGLGVVTATGQSTEVGRIQTLVDEVEPLETPLSRQLDAFGKALALLIAVMAVVMVLVGRLVHDFDIPELVSATIGFAVAAVPEGLPALVTIILALGVQQMARERAITRKLPAVEALGSVTTICSDKTGTLTKNEMTARTVVTRAAAYEVTGIGYAPDGEIRDGGAPVRCEERPDLAELVTVMARCNDAVVRRDGDDWTLVGVPTDGALRTLALKASFDDPGGRRLDVVPFDSQTKYMATLDRAADGSLQVSVKGAPDRILDRCGSQRGADGSTEPLDREWWSERIEDLGSQGLRVLAAAVGAPRPGEEALSDEDVSQGLEMVGLVGIVDPPRPEAVAAIEKCHRAGIRVKMITGDHAGTALAIGREMGIVEGEGVGVLTGAELEAMSTTQLREAVLEVDIYARTSPEHKIRIVSALQHHREVVAMTGDGVNDAPALTQADVGVAMGIKGTEATKEAADVVLADDNFATIEKAVEEGRRIYDNVRKSVLFLLPTNGAQALVMLVAVVFGMTLPLEPVQVLWINMVTAVTLSLALAYEKAEPGIMDRRPRDPGASVVDLAYGWRIAVVSVLIGGAALLVFTTTYDAGLSLDEARTAAVTMLALGQLAYLFNSRYLDASSLTTRALRGNPAVWISSAAMVLAQIGFVYLPFMNTWFESAPIGLDVWGYTAALAIAVFLLVEVGKAVDRWRGVHGEIGG